MNNNNTFTNTKFEIWLKNNKTIKFYSNSAELKTLILKENRGKAGIYMWTHVESGKFYIGSTFDISERMYNNFSIGKLKQSKTAHINNALLHHKHSAFSLTILKYIDISNLDKKEARELIFSSEQYFLDLIFSPIKLNTYNILPTAGSSLGAKHLKESIAKMSGENNHMFNKYISNDTLAKMSEAKIGKDNPMSKKVYIYSKESDTIKETIIYKSFDTCIDVAKFFNCSTRTITNYLDKNKLYKNQWILTSSPKNKKN
jgi:group I intron endonuclease